MAALFIEAGQTRGYGRGSCYCCVAPSRLSLPLTGDNPDDEPIPLYEGDMAADLLLVARNQLAETITGGLSYPSKLPCPSWGIPATRCRLGSVLAQQRGTVCNRCYALGGRYRFAAVQRKLEQRYQGLAHPLWTPAMVFLINYYCDRFFRWFDSGDVASESHLRNIFTIARHTREVLHWLPSREVPTLRRVLDHEELPENLVLRVSATRIDGPPPQGFPHTSTVAATQPRSGSHLCPASEQGNHCGDCRACWDPEVQDVAYWLH